MQLSPAWKSHLLVREGITFLTSREPLPAIDCFQRSLGLQKANPDAYYYLARALTSAGEFSDASKTLALVAERIPQLFSADDRDGFYTPFDPETFGFTRAARLNADDIIILTSHRDLEAGFDLIQKSDYAGAIIFLLRALEQNPWNIHAHYFLAQAYARGGNLKTAELVLKKAIETFPFVFKRSSRFGEYQGFDLDPPTTMAYYRALAGSFPDLNCFLSDCSRTGSSSGSLSKSQETTLLKRFLAAREDWLRGLVRPEKAIMADGSRDSSDLRLLFVGPQFVKCDANWIDYDVTLHYIGTAHKFFQECRHYVADDIHSENLLLSAAGLSAVRPAHILMQGIVELRRELEAFRPDIIFFDGNFTGGRGGISVDDWLALKSSFDFKLVIWIGDIYPPKANNPLYWSSVADLIVAMNDHAYLTKARQNCDVLIWPGVTVDPAVIGGQYDDARSIDISFVGARKSYRDMWCSHLALGGVQFHHQFTDQSGENSISLVDYVDVLKASKIGFNSGLVSSRDHHTNFRLFETLSAGTALLQHDFPLLHSYFQPYVHYAPFDNIHEMLTTARFLLRHDDIRTTMAAEGQAWYRDNYGGRHFWAAVEDRLMATSEYSKT